MQHFTATSLGITHILFAVGFHRYSQILLRDCSLRSHIKVYDLAPVTGFTLDLNK
jgi:hypothetical protein